MGDAEHRRDRAAWAVAGLLLLGVLALGANLRMLDAPTVRTAEGIRPVGPDAYYHLRRVCFSYANFPEVLERDPYLNHPTGGDVIWPPGLDWSVAAAARLRLGPDVPPERLAAFAMAVPVWLGGAAILGCFAWGAWRFGPGSGLAAAGVLAILPAHAVYSRFGMLDHHAAEPLVTLAFLAAGSGLALRASGAERWAGRDVAAVGALAATQAGSLLVWPGSLLQLLLVSATFAAWAVFLDARFARALCLRASLVHGLSLLFLLPFAGRDYAYWGGFAPVVLGGFQPWLLACASLCFAALASVAHRPPAQRLAVALGSAAALALGSGLLLPELGEAPGRMWSWLARTESFQSQVAESQALFAPDPRGRLAEGLQQLSGGFLFVPVLAWAFLARLRQRPFDPSAWLFLVLLVGLALATLAQRRFANPFSVLLALLLGWTFVVELPRRLRLAERGRFVRALLAGGTVALGLLLLLPTLQGFAPALERRAALRAGQPMRLAADQLQRRELHRLASWLRGNSPPTSGFEARGGSPPEYGVLGFWANGHILLTAGERPAVVTNFGDDLGPEGMDAMARYFAASEPEAAEILDAFGVRYVVLEYRRQGALAEFGPRSMIARAFFADGQAAQRSRARTLPAAFREVVVDVPALERHRLVYEARPKPWAPEQPFFKLYEFVRGAELEGRAPPGAEVSVELALATAGGREFAWGSRTRAGTDGVYRLRVPYATREANGRVRSRGGYGVFASGAERTVDVGEEDVREGRRIAAPDFSR